MDSSSPRMALAVASSWGETAGCRGAAVAALAKVANTAIPSALVVFLAICLPPPHCFLEARILRRRRDRNKLVTNEPEHVTWQLVLSTYAQGLRDNDYREVLKA